MGTEDFTPDDKTPTVTDPCPDCGSQMVQLGIPCPPPDVDDDIWDTIYGIWCVNAPSWRWCCGIVGALPGKLVTVIPRTR